jgi:hypothetical protein
MSVTNDYAKEVLASTPQSEERAVSAGVSNAQGLLNQGGDFSQTLGMADQGALSQAIKNKANKSFVADSQDLKRTASLDAKNAHFSKLQTAGQLSADEDKVNFQKAMAKYKAKMAKKAARGQLLGNVLGIAGAAVGAFAGGPAGAVAGAQLGQGVGQMAGGAM